MSILENEQEFLAQKFESAFQLAKETTAQDSEEITKKGVKKLTKAWLDAKRPLIELLGGQTRVEKVVESELELEDARKIVKPFVEKITSGKFTYKRADYTMQQLMFKDSDFIFDLNGILQSSEGVKALQANTVTEELMNHVRFKRICSNIGLDPQRQKGAKFTKFFLAAFKVGMEKFNLLKDEEAVRELDIISQDFSQLINTMKTAKRKQTVVLSCDLDDFLTMSMGTSWESCHRLGKMYGMGALAYALSPNVLVAYVKSDTHEYEKKWRQVVYCDVQTGFAVGSRQYPSSNMVASDGARNIWQECYSLATTGTADTSNFKFSKSPRGLRQRLTKSNGFAYIDILEFSPSSENIDGHVWSTWIGGEEKPVIDCCPKEIVCLQCGNMHRNVRSHRVTCGECPREGQYKCRECGRWHAEETCTYVGIADGYVCRRCLDNEYTYCPICQRWEREYYTTVVQGRRICESCAHTYYHKCDRCSEWHSRDEEHIEFIRGGRVRRYCSSCAEDVVLHQCSHCNQTYHSTETTTVHGGKHVCRGCLHRYYSACGFCDEYHLRPTVHIVEHEYESTRVCQRCREADGLTGTPLPTETAGSSGSEDGDPSPWGNTNGSRTSSLCLFL